MSDCASSSLSELEESTVGTLGQSFKDIDSEAETERLEVSPRKAEPLTNKDLVAGSTLSGNSAFSSRTFVQDDENNHEDATTEDVETNTLEHQSETRDSKRVDEDAATDADTEAALLLLSPVDTATRKRKRASSMSAGVVVGVDAPPAKRKSPTDHLYPSRLRQHVDEDDDSVSGEEGEDRLFQRVTQKLRRDVANHLRDLSPEESQDIEAASVDNEERSTSDDKAVDIEHEAETASHADDADEDLVEGEVETVAKNMDEVLKKTAALDALKPIEKHFAIFRDKLFDERLTSLSNELDLLREGNTLHPDFLAMRLALDSHRDEKIRLEQVTLRLKTNLLERKCLAERSQLHSQYFQTVRETREGHMEIMDEHFSRIKRDFRQWAPPESHYIHRFNPKRSQQVLQQTAYNKEVSLLSGIARYVGFPAAPIMEGARQSEIDDDFRAMKIKPQASQPFVTPMANASRADEVAAEEQFFEQTPWANPNHPSIQHVRHGIAQTSRNLGHLAVQPWLAEASSEHVTSRRRDRSNTESRQTPSGHVTKSLKETPNVDLQISNDRLTTFEEPLQNQTGQSSPNKASQSSSGQELASARPLPGPDGRYSPATQGIGSSDAEANSPGVNGLNRVEDQQDSQQINDDMKRRERFPFSALSGREPTFANGGMPQRVSIDQLTGL